MTRGSDIPTAFFEVLLNLANKPQQSVGRRNELENGAALDAVALECTRPVLWIRFQGLTNQMPSHMLNPSLTAETYHLRLQGPGTCPGAFGGAMLRIDFNRLRFLVIDDNAHMRRILRTLLHGFGAREVYEAEDGASGLEAFTHFVPDIIITDWAMPIFDGLELAQMIRQPGANANPYVPIIMLTGHSEKKRVTSARDAGVTEFMAKPISAKALYQRVLNVVANPRPFIKTKTYFGPDRRRNVNLELCRAGASQGRQGGHDPPDRSDRTRPRSPAEDRTPSMAKNKQIKNKRTKPSVATFGDYEMITPPNPLRMVVSEDRRTRQRRRRSGRARREGADGSCRANSPRGWMRNASGSTLRAAMSRSKGFTKATRDALFHAAHDIKGEAATFGYPLVAAPADSLCRLIEHTPDMTRIPLALVDQHVDAIRAIIRENARPDVAQIADALTKRLREVTDEFLAQENKDRPDVLAGILAPSIVPTEPSF